MNYIPMALDLIVKGVNFLPGWKTKAGAVLKVIGTIMAAIATTGLYPIPNEVVFSVNSTADVLLAAGVANLMNNNQKK